MQSSSQVSAVVEFMHGPDEFLARSTRARDDNQWCRRTIPIRVLYFEYQVVENLIRIRQIALNNQCDTKTASISKDCVKWLVFMAVTVARCLHCCIYVDAVEWMTCKVRGESWVPL